MTEYEREKRKAYGDKYREDHREEIRAKSRAVYYFRKEHGICVNCGYRDAMPGKVYCFKCALDASRKTQEKKTTRLA